MQAMNHAQVGESLCRHLVDKSPASQWICCREVEWHEYRFDVVAVSVWHSRKDIRVYEVKVTQHDLDREMQKGKWGGIVEAKASPYLALGPGLKIDKKDLPPGLGLAVLNHAGWRHLVKVKPSDPMEAGHLLYETLATTRREFSKIIEDRRLDHQEYIAGENVPDIPWAVQRAARVAGQDLRYWIRRMKDQESDWKSQEDRLESREKKLIERERKFQDRNGDAGLLEILDEAKAANLTVSKILEVLDIKAASQEATRILNALAWNGQAKRRDEQ